MNTRGFIFVAVIALSLFVGTSVASGADPQEDQNKVAPEELLQKLLHQRVATAELAKNALQVAFEAETTTIFALFEAVNKLLEARLAVAVTPAQEIDAREKHLQLMRGIEAKMKVLFEIGTRGGERKEYFSAKRESETAQIELLKARLRAVMKGLGGKPLPQKLEE